MNEERATGLVLRTRPFSETSLILHWLTPSLGRVATIAKGARRAKSPFRGKLDVFYELDISFARSRRSDLHTLREAVLRHTHPSLREDLHRLEQAAYATALIEQATETETPLPAVFAMLRGLLRHLDLHAPAAPAVLAFEIKFLDEFGLAPPAAAGELSAGGRGLLETLRAVEWTEVGRVQPGAGLTRELGRYLGVFLLRHFDRVPRARRAALLGPDAP